MAFDVFMKIDGAPGESTDDAYGDYIEVQSLSWGLTQPSAGSRSTAGAAASGRVEADELTFVHAMDKAAPKLNAMCTEGKHIDKIEIVFTRATGEKQVYLKYELENTIVTGTALTAEAYGEDGLPSQEVTMNYGSIKETYTETDHNTGASKGNVEFGWDFEKNKAK